MNVPDSSAIPEATTVLIVDDNPGNLGVLFENLERCQCRVLVALSGRQALTQLMRVLPDLILLDVLMPDMDGFETCRRIREREELRDIPVLFMSALTDPRDKVRGFEAGGVDYITKPLDEREVIARVGTHVALHAARRQLLERNQLLHQQSEELRQRNRLLQGFSSMVAHDLRDRLASILGYSELLLSEMDQGRPVAPSDVQHIRDAGLAMHEIFESLLLLGGPSGTEQQLMPIDTRAIVARVQRDLGNTISERGARIVKPSTWPDALGHDAWVERVWYNYLSNALKYGGERPTLTLGADSTDAGTVRFWVRDQGPGIPDHERDKVFQPFHRLRRIRAAGYGLGLAIVARIVEKLGGEAGVVPVEGGGAEFYFTLPARPPG